MKRFLLVIAVVCLVAVAGCVTAPADDDTEPPVEDDSPGESVADDTDDDSSDDSDEPANDTGDSDDGTDPPAASGELELHHIDVGQADATLIVTPDNETILIDTGDWRPAGTQVIEYLEDRGIERIDHLIATHAHADHIGGHAAIIEHFEENHDGIGEIYDSGVPHDSQTFENYLDVVDEYGHELLIVEEGDELPLASENVTASVVNPPEGDSGTDLHYNSVSLVIEFGDVRYLTTGDAEEDAEARMVDDWAEELSADIYHAGHHGSSTSSTQAFLDAVDPEIAVISSALESQYGHPHDKVLERFDEFEIETYWTGVHGDIVLTTDGEEVTTEPATNATTDPRSLLDKKPDDEDDEQNSYSRSVPTITGIPLAASA